MSSDGKVDRGAQNIQKTQLTNEVQLQQQMSTEAQLQQQQDFRYAAASVVANNAVLAAAHARRLGLTSNYSLQPESSETQPQGLIAPTPVAYNQLYIQGIPPPGAYWPPLNAGSTSQNQPSPGRYGLSQHPLYQAQIPPHLIASAYHSHVANALTGNYPQNLAGTILPQQMLVVSAAGPVVSQHQIATSQISPMPPQQQQAQSKTQTINKHFSPQPQTVLQQQSFTSQEMSVNNPSTSQNAVAPSPSGASSAPDEASLDDSKFHSPSFQSPTPSSHRTPGLPATPSSSTGGGTNQSAPDKQQNLVHDPIVSGGLKQSQVDAIEKLVNACTGVPPHLLPERRVFFERLVQSLHERGETLSAPPQVSKTIVDLHRLYVAVRRRGGFENVTKEKAWKLLCPEANPGMQESSAAGYQLRRHYQRFLLFEECRETGQNPEDLINFAEKQKKKKKEKDPQPSPISTPVGSQTPVPSNSSIRTPLPTTQTQLSSTGGPPSILQPTSVSASVNFPLPQGMPTGSHPLVQGEFNSGTGTPYYYSGQHQAMSGPHGWSNAQHVYPAAYQQQIRPVQSNARTSSGIGELTEEQQRQQQHYFHQQHQQAYAVHVQQQQQLMAVAAAQQLQHQQQQQLQQQQQHSSALQVPSSDVTGTNNSRGPSCSTTPLPPPQAVTPAAAAASSRASSVGPTAALNATNQAKTPDLNRVNDESLASQHINQARPSSQQQRHTPSPNHSYATSANAPTPPLTTSISQLQQTQLAAAQLQQQSLLQPNSHSQAQQMQASNTITSAAPMTSNYYAPPGATPYTVAMRPGAPPTYQLPPGVRPSQGGYVMYPNEIPNYSAMYLQQPIWPIPPHVVPSQTNAHQQRFVGAPPTAEQFASMQQQQQQLKNQQQQQAVAFQQHQAAAAAAVAAQQQQSQLVEAQRRQATASNYYGASSAAPPAAINVAAAAGLPSASAHSPGSAQRTRFPSSMPSGHHFHHQQQQQLLARAGASQHNNSFGLYSQLAPSSVSSNAVPGPSTSFYNAAVIAGASVSFPPGSIEAITTNPAILKRKRPKILTRDLTQVTLKRILMALRSGLTLESIWAINTLNILLYDDTAPSFNLHFSHDLLNAVLEHFISSLSFLFPKHFKVLNRNWLLNMAESNDDFDYVVNDKLLTSIPIKTEKGQKSKNIGSITTIVKDDKQSIRPVVRSPMGRQSSSKFANYTRVSRTGRQVCEQSQEMLYSLKRLLPAHCVVDQINRDESTDVCHLIDCFNVKGGGLAERIYFSLIVWAQSQQNIRKSLFNNKSESSTWEEDDCYKENFNIEEKDDDFINDNKKTENGFIQENNNKIENEENCFYYRKAKPSEKWDRFSTPNCSLMTRPGMFHEQDDVLLHTINKCLALSNIIRGFSFIPGNERILCNHLELLKVIAILLRLFTKDNENNVENVKSSLFTTSNDDELTNVDDNKDDIKETDDRKSTKQDLTIEQKEIKYKRENRRQLLIEAANHLRDDAFTILAHISLDLYDVDNNVSWSIFDSLLYWSVSTNLQARDPMLPGVLSPKNYVLEILCKMSVIERNVDLLLSTGPWPRIEEFIRVLCNLINLSEELPCREFAIVILNAICSASEAACYVAAMETPVLNNLVSFLELADTNMHQIVQQHGMQALRDNPELMGTSVGMLRRATLIMLHIARNESCRKLFSKLQNRLLKFTVSHFMDSRVAAMVADILFEMQRSENNVVEMKTFCPPLNLADTSKQLDKLNVNELDSEIIIKENGNLKIDSNYVQEESEVELEQKESDQNDSKNVYQTIGDKNLLLKLENNINNDYKPASFSSIIHHINGTDDKVDDDNSTFFKIKENSVLGKRSSLSPSSKHYERKSSASPNSVYNCHNKNNVMDDQQLLQKKTASESVMEKLRNNILKHGEDKINNCASESDIPLKRPKIINGAHYLNNHGQKLNGQRNNAENALLENEGKKPIKANNNNNLDLSNESNIIKVNNGDENNVHYTNNEAKNVKTPVIVQQNQEVSTTTKSTASTASSATASSGSLTAVA